MFIGNFSHTQWAVYCPWLTFNGKFINIYKIQLYILYVLLHIIIHLFLIYIFIYNIFFFQREKTNSAHTLLLSAFRLCRPGLLHSLCWTSSQHCWVLSLAHTFKLFCTMVNNIKAIPTWGLLLVSPLDIDGDWNVIGFFGKGKGFLLLGGMHIHVSSCKLMCYNAAWVVLWIGNGNLICCAVGEASLGGM